eukprot:UC4_evm1s514
MGNGGSSSSGKGRRSHPHGSSPGSITSPPSIRRAAAGSGVGPDNGKRQARNNKKAEAALKAVGQHTVDGVAVENYDHEIVSEQIRKGREDLHDEHPDGLLDLEDGNHLLQHFSTDQKFRGFAFQASLHMRDDPGQMVPEERTGNELLALGSDVDVVKGASAFNAPGDGFNAGAGIGGMVSGAAGDRTINLGHAGAVESNLNEANDITEFNEKTWFSVEHLASIPIQKQYIAEPTPEDGLWAVKEFGGMWTKNMSIQINSAGVILADPDNSNQKLAMHRIEEITQSAAILDDEDFGDLTAYVTEHKKNSVVHIFQTRESTPGSPPLTSKEMARTVAAYIQEFKYRSQGTTSEQQRRSLTAENGWTNDLENTDATIDEFVEPNVPFTVDELDGMLLQTLIDEVEDFLQDFVRKINEIKFKELHAKSEGEGANRKSKRASKKEKKKSKEETGAAQLIKDLRPSPSEYVNLYQKVRACFNLVAKLGNKLQEPYTDDDLTAKLIEYCNEIVASEDNFATVKAVGTPAFKGPALEKIMKHLSPQDKRFWNAMGKLWNISEDNWDESIPKSVYIPSLKGHSIVTAEINADFEERIGSSDSEDARTFKADVIKILQASPFNISGYIGVELSRGSILVSMTVPDGSADLLTSKVDMGEFSISHQGFEYSTILFEGQLPGAVQAVPTTIGESFVSNTFGVEKRFGESTPSLAPSQRGLNRGFAPDEERTMEATYSGKNNFIPPPPPIDSEEPPPPLPQRNANMNSAPPPPPMQPQSATQPLFVVCAHPHTANNPMELTMIVNEQLEVVENSKKWWKVRNSSGAEGYVPSNHLVGMQGEALDQGAPSRIQLGSMMHGAPVASTAPPPPPSGAPNPSALVAAHGGSGGFLSQLNAQKANLSKAPQKSEEEKQAEKEAALRKKVLVGIQQDGANNLLGELMGKVSLRKGDIGYDDQGERIDAANQSENIDANDNSPISLSENSHELDVKKWLIENNFTFHVDAFRGINGKELLGMSHPLLRAKTNLSAANKLFALLTAIKEGRDPTTVEPSHQRTAGINGDVLQSPPASTMQSGSDTLPPPPPAPPINGASSSGMTLMQQLQQAKMARGDTQTAGLPPPPSISVPSQPSMVATQQQLGLQVPQPPPPMMSIPPAPGNLLSQLKAKKAGIQQVPMQGGGLMDQIRSQGQNGLQPVSQLPPPPMAAMQSGGGLMDQIRARGQSALKPASQLPAPSMVNSGPLTMNQEILRSRLNQAAPLQQANNVTNIPAVPPVALAQPIQAPPQPSIPVQIEEDLPDWKKKLLQKRVDAEQAKIDAARRAVEEEEAKWEGVPAWKRSLIEKKKSPVSVQPAAQASAPQIMPPIQPSFTTPVPQKQSIDEMLAARKRGQSNHEPQPVDVFPQAQVQASSQVPQHPSSNISFMQAPQPQAYSQQQYSASSKPFQMPIQSSGLSLVEQLKYKKAGIAIPASGIVPLSQPQQQAPMKIMPVPTQQQPQVQMQQFSATHNSTSNANLQPSSLTMPIQQNAPADPQSEWKTKLIEKRNQQKNAAMQAEMQAMAMREARWEGIPAWKRAIIEKKEITAYDFVSRDWSSDVCSSDLRRLGILVYID